MEKGKFLRFSPRQIPINLEMLRGMEAIQKYFLLAKSYLIRTREFLCSDRFLEIVAVLPLFFSWLSVFTFRPNNSRMRTLALYSFLNSAIFFFLLVPAGVLHLLPYIGGYLSNLIHFTSILLYLGISGFLIYLIEKEKNIEIPILSQAVDYIRAFLDSESGHHTAPIAQLDRASDYGSEG